MMQPTGLTFREAPGTGTGAGFGLAAWLLLLFLSSGLLTKSLDGSKA